LRIVAGIFLKGNKPRVWDSTSPYYLPDLQAVMISYAEFSQMPVQRRRAMEKGLHEYLGVPEGVSIYLGNGAFYFLREGGRVSKKEYEKFVEQSKPDWYPIPQDFIPTPKMSNREQLACLRKTMAVNCAYQSDGYVPVIHISRKIDEYMKQMKEDEKFERKSRLALGGIVPNLLRAPKAMPYSDVLDSVRRARSKFSKKELHVFGIGGIATLHLAALLGIDSVDSSGWRNRAARGLVQLPGRGERIVANLGSWRGREPDKDEWELLAVCECPACKNFGTEGLKANKVVGFCHRATHNLWTLLHENQEINFHLKNKDYESWYIAHVDNSIYRPLIEYVLKIGL
jgi:7-cyano-7-deazaguanine tRNA-ribosyltransferase